MDQIILLKIESLHARVVQEAGLKFKKKNKEFFTGPIVALLDEHAKPPANLGLINLGTGEIRLRWSIVATIPFMADAFLSGQLPEKDREVLRISFDESGQVPDDGSGFDAYGGGEVAAGSMFSAAKLASQNNFVRVMPDARRKGDLLRSLANGDSVQCGLIPESYLDLVLPKSLGGGNARLNLVGAFVLVPIMTLGPQEAKKRARR